MSQKALGYGIARDRFDGDDVIRVRDRIAEAVARARNESMPTLIEIMHLPLPRPLDVATPACTARKEEVEEWKKRDPLAYGARAAGAREDATRRTSSPSSRRSTEEIEEAVKFAEESPELAYERLAEFTYKE